MAIVGAPIANGDGSYTFQQDTGEPLVLRGMAAEQAFSASQGAPPNPLASPAPDSQSAAGPSMSDATGLSAPPTPTDPLAGLAPAQQAYVRHAVANGGSLQDALGNVNSSATIGKAAGAVGGALSSAATPGAAARTAQLAQVGIAPTPAAPMGGGPAAPAGPAAPGGKPVFYTPPAGEAAPVDPNKLVSIGGTSTRSTSQTIRNKGDVKAIEAEDAKGAELSRKGAELTGEQARQETELHESNIQDQQVSQLRQQEIEAERQRVVGERRDKLDKLIQDAAADKIDPKHFWADKSSEYKFEAALFSGIGAIGEAVGGKNYGQKAIDDAITRDIEAQGANLKNKRENIAAQTNMLGQLRDEYKDQAAAETAFRSLKLGVAEEKLKAIAARNLPEQQKNTVEKQIQDINRQRASLNEQLDRKQLASSSSVRTVPAGLLAAQGQGETGSEYAIKQPARVTLDTIDNLAPMAGLKKNGVGYWTMTPGAMAETNAPTSTAKHSMAALRHALAPEIAKLRAGGRKPGEGEIESERKFLDTLSPEEFTLELNSAVRNARSALGARILHGKGQVPGSADEGD